MDTLVPLAQVTIDIVAIPRFNRQSAKTVDEDIDVTACMSLLYLAALGCVANQEFNIRFWKLMRYDVCLYMLSANQNAADLDIMISLLSTSVLKESFGAIPGDSYESMYTSAMLDRLTLTLHEVPCLPMSQEKMQADAVLKLRLRILQLLTSMTRSQFASKAIAEHTHAIGRLVCLISDELDVLYDYKATHRERCSSSVLTIPLLC